MMVNELSSEDIVITHALRDFQDGVFGLSKRAILLFSKPDGQGYGTFPVTTLHLNCRSDYAEVSQRLGISLDDLPDVPSGVYPLLQEGSHPEYILKLPNPVFIRVTKVKRSFGGTGRKFESWLQLY